MGQNLESLTSFYVLAEKGRHQKMKKNETRMEARSPGCQPGAVGSGDMERGSLGHWATFVDVWAEQWGRGPEAGGASGSRVNGTTSASGRDVSRPCGDVKNAADTEFDAKRTGSA